MFGPKWQLSPRSYDLDIDLDVSVPLSDGNRLSGMLFRPKTDEQVPAILGFHPYSNEYQIAPVMPIGFGLQRGWMEAGDPRFFARRGYAHGTFNVRGTGKSTGNFLFNGKREIDDLAEAVQWIAGQPWCDGNIGVAGVSYLAREAVHVAMREPPALKAIFAPFATTDLYRDYIYHGGILAYRFVAGWKDKLDGLRYESIYLQEHGEAAYHQAIDAALADEEIASIPVLVQALRSPHGSNAFLADVVLEKSNDAFFRERAVPYDHTSIPAYLGACWGVYGLHLNGAFRGYERWDGPKKLLIGPPRYLDRPVYQLQYEQLRWFDHWLKGNDTGFMEEDPIRLFVPGRESWRTAEEWPLPETRWTPFFFHNDGLLSEHELWDWDHASGFEDSPFHRGEVVFRTPPLVEQTEMIGSSLLDLHISTTDTECLIFASLFVESPDGVQDEMCRGWLRLSQRATNPERSRPWQPYREYQGREAVVPNEIYRVQIELAPFGRLLNPGERVGLRIKAADNEPAPDAIRGTAFGHIARESASRITIHHSNDHPSSVSLPVTLGNYLETYISGGVLDNKAEPLVIARIPRIKVDTAGS
jgi:predicted acyl esterase